MQNEILDNLEPKNTESPKTKTLIATGVFFYLAIVSVAYTFNFVITDTLIMREMPPPVIFWAREISMILLVFVCSITGLKKINKVKIFNFKGAEAFLWWVIIIYIVGQSTQFVYTYYSYDIWSEALTEKRVQFYRVVEDVNYSGTVRTFLSYLKPVIVGAVLLINKRQ